MALMRGLMRLISGKLAAAFSTWHESSVAQNDSLRMGRMMAKRFLNQQLFRAFSKLRAAASDAKHFLRSLLEHGFRTYQNKVSGAFKHWRMQDVLDNSGTAKAIQWHTR